MATKKTVPPVPVQTTALTNWDEELAKLAEESSKTEENVGGGNFLGTKGGILTYKGTAVPGNSLDVVIPDHIMENAFYENAYDPNNPQPPVCFAFGRTDEEMAPHEKSSAPQHTDCKTCPHNQWGSAATGRGKACKNVRRIALITEAELVNPMDAEVVYLRPPVTSIKGWASYVKQLKDNMNKPPLAVVTNISVVPDSTSQFKVVFRLKAEIDDNETIGALLEKRKIVANEIDFPYMPLAEGAAPPQPKRTGPAPRAKYAR